MHWWTSVDQTIVQIHKIHRIHRIHKVSGWTVSDLDSVEDRD